jgi:hypothetical protein
MPDTQPRQSSPGEDKPTALHAGKLTSLGIAHGFFQRTGGVSEGIYRSLNCGRGSKDRREHVEENRARIAKSFGLPPHTLIGPRQAHTSRTVVATAPWEANEAPEADAIVTTTRGIAIGVLTADCAPLLMADDSAGVVAAVHAGWKGAKAGVIESALDAMEGLGARSHRILAAVGPAISKAAYEVGPEFREAFLLADEDNERYFSQPQAGGRPHFDLLSYVKARLSARGIEHAEDVSLCTYENESIFFSHRRSVHRSEPDYGRQISAILLT